MNEFTVTDFTMDLIVEEEESPSVAALGKFRSLTRTEHLSAIREAASVLPSSGNIRMNFMVKLYDKKTNEAKQQIEHRAQTFLNQL